MDYLAKTLALRARLDKWAARHCVDYWSLKQAAASPSRYYGDGGTIHSTGSIDIQTDESGHVVAVWYRCQNLPWSVSLKGSGKSSYQDLSSPQITGVEVLDCP